MLKKLVVPALLAWLALATASPALAGPPHRFVVFGDSLSDPGNAFILTRDLEIPPFASLIPDAPYARGAFHFSNGPTWVEQLSLIDHALPSAGPALLLPRVLSNYAVGGARARQVVGSFDLATEVGLFLGDFHGQAPADALYVVFIGGNDMRDALEAFAAGQGGTAALIFQDALSAIGGNILTLYSAGARHFLVANAPDIGLAPAVRLLGAQGPGSALSAHFNGLLELTLQGIEGSLGIKIVRLDVFGWLNEVVTNPGSFGLSDAVDPCIRLNTVVGAFCPNPGKFLFWDGIHPTVAGHHALAVRADAVLDANALPLASAP